MANTAELAAKTTSEISSPQRPTSLFTKFSNDATTSLDTSRQTPINAAATISGGMAAVSAAALSPNSSTSSINSPSATSAASAFPAEMPQWKKDLIQRRKSNVARTLGATGAHSPTPSTSSTSLMTDHIAEDNLKTPTTPTKGAKQIASQYDNLIASATNTTIAGTGRTAEQKNAKITHSNKMPATFNSPIKSPTTFTSNSPTLQCSAGGHYTPRVEHKLDTDSAAAVGAAAAATITIETGDQKLQQQQQQQQSEANTVVAPIPKQRSTLLFSNNAGKSNSHHQDSCSGSGSGSGIGSSDSTSQRIEANTNTIIATTKSEMGETSVSATSPSSLTTRLAGFEASVSAASASAATATLSQQRAAEVFETQETETARKLSSSSSSSSLLSPSAKCGTYTARQSHSKFESERTLSPVSLSPSSIGKINSNNSCTIINYHTACGSQASGSGVSDGITPFPTTIITNTTTTATVCDSEKTASPIVCCKISSKLQNNQFIKNQVKYQQQHQQQQKSVDTSSPGATAVIPTQLLSPTSSPSLTSPNKLSNSNNKKKMVAVQEMKKTTPQQNAAHQLHHHRHQHVNTQSTAVTACGRQRLQQRNSNNDDSTESANIVDVDFDPSEDLSYGPGIVSKLRCRYLSLALRESMEKQRHCLDNLRRATSLNNLLDRNNDEDDEDDDEEENGEHYDDIDAASDVSGKLDKASIIVSGGGILKRATQYNSSNSESQQQPQQQQQQQQQLFAKKTSIYQKNISSSSTANSNGYAAKNQRNSGLNSTEYTTDNASKIPTGNNTNTTNETSNGAPSATPRHGSRHLKRGNDSLKRARSVEALLCEKTPWNFAMNRSSIQSTAGYVGGHNASTIVTIEDKIHNARERLIIGADVMPPRRLTSIIDDTERPPPDLVKQTLKMFEATANRRGRGGQRSAVGAGEVATKVANYKSIIKEQKPTIVFPKPPASPSKKLNPTGVKNAAKPIKGSAELLNSPVGRKTAASSLIASSTTPTMSEVEKQLTASSPKPRERVSLSATTVQPDNLSQRHKLLSEPKSEQLASSVAVDSPVTTLTKKLEKLCIENEKQSSMKHSSVPKESNPMKTMEIIGSEGASLPLLSKKLVVGGFSSSTDDAATSTNTILAAHETSHHDKNTENLRRLNCAGNSGTTIEEADARFEEKGDENNGNNSNSNSDKNNKVSVDSDVRDFTFTALRDHTYDRDSNAQGIGIAIVGGGGSGTLTASSSDLSDDDENGRVPVSTRHVTKTALENIAKAGTTQQFKFATASDNKIKQILNGDNFNTNQQQNIASNQPQELPNSMLNLRATTTTGGKQIGVIRPLLTTTPPNNNQQQHLVDSIKQQQQQQQQNQSSTPTQLTSREIEKNRINEMKKTAANASSMTTTAGGAAAGTAAGAAAGGASPTTSLDTVINTNSNSFLNKLTTATSLPATSSPIPGVSGASGFNELDATNSPLWALRKKRQTPPAAATENTTMVFNFRDREKVPDYIENDGVIFRRKRVLPKPNESGFVRLPDLTLETSTDSDYDDFSMCPPSPCDVQFENANIVIDGKSSIRQKPKEATFRVQFNETLTSTFEYPSEASLIVEESFEEVHYANASDLVSAYENLVLDHIDSATSSPAHHHHHVAVDEIIPLPTTTTTTTSATSPIANTNTATATTPTKNILGNLPLGSAPLGFYTPVKAPIDNLFQLGVTRAPIAGSDSSNNCTNNSNGGGIKDNQNDAPIDGEEPESLQYIKPANDDLTVAYSEGTQKTDLLY